MNGKKINITRRYVIITYIAFWCSIALVAAVFLASGQNMNVFNWASSVSSWTPTIVLLIMFKKLFPGMTMKEWLKKSFAPHINVGMLLAITGVFTLCVSAAIGIVTLRTGSFVINIANYSLPAIISTVFFTIIQGATGEEAGWRGYLQPVMGNLCLSVIIGISFNRCKNLAVPMWIHFISNVFSNILALEYTGDPIEIRLWLGLFYVLAAAGFLFWYKTSTKKAQNA